MKTQIMLVAFIALALVFAVMPLALAENNTDLPEEPALIAPPPISIEDNSSQVNEDNEADLELNESVGSGTILGQQIKLWFTFNKEKKMDQELKLARLRLIQANIAMKNNNTVAMEKALAAHERIMNKVEERMNQIKEGPKLNKLNDSAVKLVGLERAIQVHERRIAFIQNKLENANLTDEQRSKLEARLEKAQNNTAHLVQVSENKKENIKNRLMIVGNLTEEQAEELIEQREETIEQKIENKMQQRQENREQRQEDIEKIVGCPANCSCGPRGVIISCNKTSSD